MCSPSRSHLKTDITEICKIVPLRNLDHIPRNRIDDVSLKLRAVGLPSCVDIVQSGFHDLFLLNQLIIIAVPNSKHFPISFRHLI